LSMTEKARIAGATSGAIGISAFAAALGTCCVAPWAVSLLGVSGAVALVRLSFLKPYLLGGAVALLVLSFWLAYRPAPVCADGSCETRSRCKLRIAVWIATGIVGALVLASYSARVIGGAGL
jgi:hypothetical protein